MNSGPYRDRLVGPVPVLRIDSLDAAGCANRDRQHTQHIIVAVSLPHSLVSPRGRAPLQTGDGDVCEWASVKYLGEHDAVTSVPREWLYSVNVLYTWEAWASGGHCITPELLLPCTRRRTNPTTVVIHHAIHRTNAHSPKAGPVCIRIQTSL